MSHKVSPKSFRMQVIDTWDSRWFAPTVGYSKFLKQDLAARAVLTKALKDALVDSIVIERSSREITFTIFAAKPGVAIGRGGKGIEDLQKVLERSVFAFKTRVRIQVHEVRNPSLSASIVAQGMRNEIERRIPFRRVMKQTIEKVMKAGAAGIKIKISGRLNGVEIARDEMLSAGKVPLQTLRSNIDYALEEAQTTFGVIGIKVWICKGEVFQRMDKLEDINSEKK